MTLQCLPPWYQAFLHKMNVASYGLAVGVSQWERRMSSGQRAITLHHDRCKKCELVVSSLLLIASIALSEAQGKHLCAAQVFAWQNPIYMRICKIK